MLGFVRDSLGRGQRGVHYVTGVGNRVDYEAEVLCDSITDWRGMVVGSVLNIEDHTFVHRVFDAIALIGKAIDTESAIKAIVEATELLGYKKSRLYMTAEGHGPYQFVSKLARGLQ